MTSAHSSSERATPLDFWIVTKIDGVYRPLAGVRRNRPYKKGLEVPTKEGSTPFWWIITIFSDPANRVGIEAERAMAIDFYRAGFKSWVLILLYEEPPNLSNRSVVVEHQFPFIVECLLLGVCHHRSNDLYRQNTKPLVFIDSIYKPEWRPGNTIVFDITNLDDLRGGIILPGVMTTQPYHLFSAFDFVKEFGYIDTIGDIRTLEHLKPIDPLVVNFTQISNNAIPITHIMDPLGSVLNQFVTALIERTVFVYVFDECILGILRGLPNLKDLLQRHLYLSGSLGRTRSAGQFIGLAFAEETHVDLVRFRGISVEALGFAFETGDMSNTRSLALCVDSVRGLGIARMDAELIINAVSKLPSLRHLYCFLEPGRDNCTLSRELYKLVMNRSDLLQRMEVTFNGSFSLSLREMPWVGSPYPGHLASACHPPSGVVPIQHMFMRRCRPAEPSRISNIDWTTSYYLAHGLLRPEAFAAKFLRYLWQPPGRLAAFSAGPPSLTDMSRIEIRPLLEWNSLQGISQGAWVLLLSIEGKSQVQAVKYALVRMNGNSYKKFTAYGASVTPSEIDVVGLKEFLAISAPAVDPALVDRSLAETTKHMASWVNEADQSPGLERLSVMDLYEAVSMLNGCLESAFDFIDSTSLSRSTQDPAYWYLPARGGRL
ncbi:hypothetical protein F4813DRAFT_389659 [Daldinia decipiens]|uniref:uncharacterized protein n=1 Tax=Daldinia decipiens TaxID=326647 RepID=UPI0020C4F401|nr:uncharacterized protein F4813DRAFT_389659 [Daldinia decipiens]KAI1657481.1 hypothetical protein F4813DRAFT_389659 [Daldinia decipiens]